MKLTATLTLAFLTMLGAPLAHAWSAAAVNAANQPFVVTDAETPAQAGERVIAACVASDSGNCTLLRAPVRATATVLVKGASGVFVGVDPNPEDAEATAYNDCMGKNTDCKVVAAAWDSGRTWAAVAVGADWMFVERNATTREDAIKDAIDGCAKDSSKPAECAIQSESNSHAFFVIVKSSLKDLPFYGSHATLAKARQIALEKCAKESGSAASCATKHEVENLGGTPAPKYMQQLRAKAERARHVAQN